MEIAVIEMSTDSDCYVRFAREVIEKTREGFTEAHGLSYEDGRISEHTFLTKGEDINEEDGYLILKAHSLGKYEVELTNGTIAEFVL